jgi:hypothetical protein
MKVRTQHVLTQLLVLVLSAALAFEPVAFAQDNPQVQPQPVFSQQELDQMLAPIALYPDSLMSQILMASTYPLEVVQAARWSRANPNLTGDQAVMAVAQHNWDPSVKSLVAFPQILMMMDEKLDWTERLGGAFLSQQSQVMDTVQNLRQKAYAAGNLRSSDQVRVEPQGQIIIVEPANPQVIYVPYYDPMVVYGPWWWPGYPPVYWAPWPGYFVRPGITVGFTWGIGITVGAGFFFGAFDWHQRHVNVVNVNNYYYNRTIVNRVGAWEHDPGHRRGIPYRDAALRQQYGRTSVSPEARRDFRGHDPSSFEGRRELGNRPGTRGGPGSRSEERGSPGGPGERPNTDSTPPRANVPEASRPDVRSDSGRRSEERSVPPGRANVPEASRPDVRSDSGRRSEERSVTPGRANVPEASRPDVRSAPSRPSAPSAGSIPPSRPTVPEASRPEVRSAPSHPIAPSVARPPHVEQRPHALDGVGRGADVRHFSERGRASVPPPSSGKSHGSRGDSSGSSQSQRR